MTLNELRKSRGMTLEMLASELGVSRQAVHGYEKTYRTPRLKTMQKIARFFDVSLDAIDWGTASNDEVKSIISGQTLYTVEEVANSFGFSEATLRKLVDENKISFYNMGTGTNRIVRFTQQHIDEYLASVEVKAN